MTVASPAFKVDTECLHLKAPAVHHLLHPLGSYLSAEYNRQCRGEVGVTPAENERCFHQCDQCRHLIRHDGFGHGQAVGEQLPCAGDRFHFQLHLAVADVPPRGIQRCTVFDALILFEDIDRVNRTRNSGTAREFIDRVFVSHLAQVMHQQKTDLQFLCQSTERLQFGIIIAVRDIRRRGTDQLEGVDGDECDSGMFMFEFPNPIAHTAFDRSAAGGKVQSGRHIVRNGIEPFLNPAFGILQTEVKCFSLCNGESPHRLSFCDVNAEVKDKP